MMPQLIIGILILLAILGTLFMALFAISAVMLSSEISAIRFSLRHRKSWRKLTPSQRGIILLAGATQLETWASQMRTEAADLADG